MAAARAHPQATLWCHAGVLQAQSGDLPAAVEALRQAIALDPAHADAHAYLGVILATQQQTAQAEQVLARALELAPQRSDVLYAYTRLLTESGRAPQAVALLRAALARRPDDALLQSKLCMMLNYLPDHEHELFEAHCRYGALTPPAPPRPVRDPDPRRPVRLGVLSPDLREHSVAYFLRPILEGLDRTQFEVWCYSVGPTDDRMTPRLRAAADRWHDLFAASDDDVCRRIEADGIDILLDLAGHTAGHRLSVLARRPAPVQGTYLGYPNTTGLSAVDFRLVDAVTDPPGSELRAVEQLVRLPGCFVCYAPPEDAPTPQPRPSGPIVFGSFNSLAKISEPTAALWARILHALPGSRLMLKGKGLNDPAVAARFIERFERLGIEPARLDLLGHTPATRDHLAAYGRVDVALDPFPYGGTTTTCEALWMGVPVITLRGDSHRARVGASLLQAAGLTDWIAASPDEYQALAVTLAQDANQRAELRRTLRTRLAASPLCNRTAFVRDFGQALRAVWHQRCAGAPRLTS